MLGPCGLSTISFLGIFACSITPMHTNTGISWLLTCQVHSLDLSKIAQFKSSAPDHRETVYREKLKIEGWLILPQLNHLGEVDRYAICGPKGETGIPRKLANRCWSVNALITDPKLASGLARDLRYCQAICVRIFELFHNFWFSTKIKIVQHFFCTGRHELDIDLWKKMSCYTSK